jgi:hypothetical protein
LIIIDVHRDTILSALKAILILGNIEFEERPISGIKLKPLNGDDLVAKAAPLLGFSSEQLV